MNYRCIYQDGHRRRNSSAGRAAASSVLVSDSPQQLDCSNRDACSGRRRSSRCLNSAIAAGTRCFCQVQFCSGYGKARTPAAWHGMNPGGPKRALARYRPAQGQTVLWTELVDWTASPYSYLPDLALQMIQRDLRDRIEHSLRNAILRDVLFADGSRDFESLVSARLPRPCLSAGPGRCVRGRRFLARLALSALGIHASAVLAGQNRTKPKTRQM